MNAVYGATETVNAGPPVLLSFYLLYHLHIDSKDIFLVLIYECVYVIFNTKEMERETKCLN